MTIDVAHFDLSGRRALVLNAETPAGQAIATAYDEAGATVIRLPSPAVEAVGAAVQQATARSGGLDILVCAADRFLAKPVTRITRDEMATVMQANYMVPFYACQAAIDTLIAQQNGGNIVLVTQVLGQRGLPNTSAYAAAHGALHNLIRALAQEVAPHAISVNGIALGWMDWMDDRLPADDIEANRAIRFTMSKRTGRPQDIGPLAVWLAGSGVGFVTGQIFPLDGGLTQHL